MGVEFTGDDQQLLKGRRQVAVDDDVVEKVAVMEFDPLAAADHFGQLVVCESARWILVERQTGVGGRTRFTQNGKAFWPAKRFDVDDVRLELARPQRFQRLFMSQIL